ncbi:MAG: FMN-binding protein [Deltaproteobacteria bacterium]|nr:FMN-binding protein [Deltaproteobacteria bacterium]MBW2629027.1 FMN-binding protein [Deltaproteobacteria bacterium]
MSSTELASRPAPPSAWHMYRAMVGVGVFCGLLIVSVFQVTRPIIEHNKAEALKKAIFHVLPDASTSGTYRLNDAGGFEILEGEGIGEQLVYAGYDEKQELVGLAVQAQGMGYQDVIGLIYGYSFAEDAIVGVQVLESKETPGLGDKIETDPAFLENFERLDVSLVDDLSEMANPIVPVKHGAKTNPWEVDGITGATISSVAIAEILNRSAQYWTPRIRNHLDDFRREE